MPFDPDMAEPKETKKQKRGQARCRYCTGICVVKHKHGVNCLCAMHVKRSCPLPWCECNG